MDAHNDGHDPVRDDAILDEDDVIMMEMGYKRELYRGLSAFANFAFGFTEVGVLASIVSLYGYGLSTGGPATMIWGFLITFFFNTIVAFSMAEICSAYPSAGSVYHWTAQLVPPAHAPVMSYICGWANFLGNAAGDSAFAFSWAQFVGAAIEASGGMSLTLQDQVGISIAVLLLWSVLNFFRIDQVGWINAVAAFCHCAAIIFLLFAIFTVPNHLNTGKWIFTTYYNDTGFADSTTDGRCYVLAMGLLTGLYAFSGFEASAHMAEETHGSRTAAPNGLIGTVIATGFGGVAILVPLLAATVNISEALDGRTDNAAVNAILYLMGDKWGAAFAWMVTFILFFAGISSVAVTARITWALMRDGAFPYSNFLGQVHETLRSPIRAILFIFVFDVLLQLLPLNPGAGLTAFYSIVGLCGVGFQVSYAIPIACHVLYSNNEVPFPETPKSLGSLSKPMGVVSVLWLLTTSVLFFLPTKYPVTSSNMNWLFLVVLVVLVAGYINWVCNSQFHFSGPKRTEHDGGALSQHLRDSVEKEQQGKHANVSVSATDDTHQHRGDQHYHVQGASSSSSSSSSAVSAAAAAVSSVINTTRNALNSATGEADGDYANLDANGGSDNEAVVSALHHTSVVNGGQSYSRGKSGRSNTSDYNNL